MPEWIRCDCGSWLFRAKVLWTDHRQRGCAKLLSLRKLREKCLELEGMMRATFSHRVVKIREGYDRVWEMREGKRWRSGGEGTES